MNTQIRRAELEDVDAIHSLAHRIWPVAYRDILSAEQIKFMLHKMYSIESLTEQLTGGVNFLIAEASQPSGFASYSLLNSTLAIHKIHKLYVLPEMQGQGIGRKLLDYIRHTVRAAGGKTLELNVNKNNPALYFYRKYGFEIFAEEDIPYYRFTLNDYVMRMPL